MEGEREGRGRGHGHGHGPTATRGRGEVRRGEKGGEERIASSSREGSVRMLTSINAHTGPGPKLHPVHLNVNEKKKRSEAQNERPALPQENGRRQTAASRRLTLICLQVEPRTRSTFTWHCYTRCSSCGLTTGSISDRRKVNFPKTFYTPFPWIFHFTSPLMHG